jgi:flagellar basal-body rod modification protein FlgD
MATAPISATGALSNAASANFSMEDLLRVTMTELTYQDPLKPVENKDFISQIAQFSSLDATQRLNQNLERLLSLQSLNQSIGVLGKNVSATVNGTSLTGRVSAISLVNSEPQMSITLSDGQVVTGVTISQLETIR